MPFTRDFQRANADIAQFLAFLNSLTSQGSRIVEIETSDNEVLQMFDRFSGIDAIQVTRDHAIRGVAIRVQWGRAWNTFTIRYRLSSGAKTEYAKRVDAIENEKLYPHLTVQVYLSNDSSRILSAAIIQTRELYRQIREGWDDIVEKRRAREDGNVFLVVPWDKLGNILIFNGVEKEFRKTRVYPDLPSPEDFF